MIYYSNLGCDAADHIDQIANELRQIAPAFDNHSIKFAFSELKQSSRHHVQEKLNKSLAGKSLSIYLFHFLVDSDKENFLLSLENSKRALSNFAYPRRNKSSFKVKNDCIYVGTSRKTTVRLMEHLGYGSDRTYSLHLAKWVGELAGGVEIRIYRFNIDDDKRYLLTYLEDALARHLEPMLGRRGNL